MRIGISCYPTYGGSGIVATELAMALAEGGDEVHVISYALPTRLTFVTPKLFFHEVIVPRYPLFEYPPYPLALATKMVEVARHSGLDVLHVHYAIPNAVSAVLARQILAEKLGVPEDIANAVAFIASDRAGFIVGSNIDVDGGHQRSIL